jgi:acetyl-CoA synthetase (ADP-forming)
MATTGTILQRARAQGQRALSEHESKRILAAYGVPIAREALVRTASEARAAARRLGYPVVLKACAAGEAHKTEKGLVAVGLDGEHALRRAFATLVDRAGRRYQGDFLVQEMVKGSREVMIGMVRDPQFGPCVMFGLGGIFTEILKDVVFRVAPLTRNDALAMVRGIRAHRILDAVRGMPAVDLDLLCRSLIAVGQIGLDHPDIAEIDVNPLIVRGDRPVAVDALVVLASPPAP